MKLIQLNTVVNNTGTNNAGFSLLCILEKELMQSEPILVDLLNSNAISSSFFKGLVK